MSSQRTAASGDRALLLQVLFLGTFWGAAEALLGGLLHRATPPTVAGRVMLVVSMGILAYAVRRTGSSWMPTGMALVAAPLKLLSAPIYGLPVTAPEVLNPALAVLSEGASYTVLCLLFWRESAHGVARLALIGAGAGALQATVFAGLVRWPGLALYPPRDVLQALGAKFPEWALHGGGLVSYVNSMVPVGIVSGALGSGMGALCRPEPIGLRPAALAAGTALCVIVFLASSWLL